MGVLQESTTHGNGRRNRQGMKNTDPSSCFLDDQWNYYNSNESWKESYHPVIQLKKFCSYLANVVLYVCLWWSNIDSEVH